eukprot:TRINITY_DN10080_c0_g1_i2.p1 TRINITY_DN10080_c0_g1~~TRINITY_DN10080_c0_g1_i2.p1  ORF type:complete len:581 (-),score=115.42 TRINITY_DN10080_c0_g1_i2:4-1746(-)
MSIFSHSCLTFSDESDEAKALILGSFFSLAASQKYPHYNIPRGVIIEKEPFTPENGKLTPSFKTCRRTFIDVYESEFRKIFLQIDAGDEEIKIIVSNVLGVEKRSLNSGDNLIKMGMNSSNSIHLKNILEKKFKTKIPSEMLGNIQDMNSVITLVKGINHGIFLHSRQKEEAEKDLGMKIKLDKELITKWKSENLMSVWETEKTDNVMKFSHVLLTGSTGFLGSSILAEILTVTTAHVYCIVRGDDEEQAKFRFEKAISWWPDFPFFASRVTVIVGDISKNNFGISKESYQKLSTTIDGIVHSAGIVDWILPYTALRETNVHGTMRILKFSVLQKLKPILVVSSSSANVPPCYCQKKWINLQDHFHVNCLMEFLRNQIQGNVNWDGYGLSKFVSEKLVWDAHAEGLPVVVVSPGMIGPSFKYCHLNPKQLYERYLSSIILSKTAPKPTSISESLEFSSVDFVASACIALFLSADSYGHRFEIPTSLISLSTLHATIESEGYEIHQIPFNLWHENMKKSGLPIMPLIDFRSEEIFEKLMDCISTKLGWNPREAKKEITVQVIKMVLSTLQQLNMTCCPVTV